MTCVAGVDALHNGPLLQQKVITAIAGCHPSTECRQLARERLDRTMRLARVGTNTYTVGVTITRLAKPVALDHENTPHMMSRFAPTLITRTPATKIARGPQRTIRWS